MAGFTRDNFDYTGYAQSMGYDEFTPEMAADAEVKQWLYDDATKNAYSEFKGQNLDKDERYKRALDIFPEGRSALGLSEALSEAEQDMLLTRQRYTQYLSEQDNIVSLPEDMDSKKLLDGYITSQIKKDKWATPKYANTNRSVIRAVLEKELEDAPTVSDVLALRDKELAEAEAKARGEFVPEKPPETEDKGFINRLSTWASNTWDKGNNAIQRARRDDDTQIATDKFIEARKSSDEAYKRDTARFLAENVAYRNDVPLSQNVQDLFQPGLTYGQVAEKLYQNPSIVAEVLASQSVDLAEEFSAQIGTTIGTTVLASETGPAAPVIGVTAGSAAAAGVTYQNVLSSEIEQGITAELQKQGKALTAENYYDFREDAVAMDAVIEKATTKASIISAAAGASGLVGGGALYSAFSKTATKLGLRTVVDDSGNLLLKSGQTLTGTVAAGAAATGIDVAGEVGSAVAVGEEVTPANVLIEVAASLPGSAVDVGSGIASRVIAPNAKIVVNAGESIEVIDTGEVVTAVRRDGNNLVVRDEAGEERNLPINGLDGAIKKHEAPAPATRADVPTDNPVDPDAAQPATHEPQTRAALVAPYADKEDNIQMGADVISPVVFNSDKARGPEFTIGDLFSDETLGEIGDRYVQRPEEGLSYARRKLIEDHNLVKDADGNYTGGEDIHHNMAKTLDTLLAEEDASQELDLTDGVDVEAIRKVDGSAFTEVGATRRAAAETKKSGREYEAVPVDDGFEVRPVPTDIIADIDPEATIGQEVPQPEPTAQELDARLAEAQEKPDGKYRVEPNYKYRPVSVNYGARNDVDGVKIPNADQLLNRDLEPFYSLADEAGSKWKIVAQDKNGSLIDPTDLDTVVDKAIIKNDNSDKYTVTTVGVSSDPEQNKNRRIVVKNAGGKEIHSLGGQKNFTIPSGAIVIDPAADLEQIRDSLMDGAIQLGLQPSSDLKFSRASAARIEDAQVQGADKITKASLKTPDGTFEFTISKVSDENPTIQVTRGEESFGTHSGPFVLRAPSAEAQAARNAKERKTQRARNTLAADLAMFDIATGEANTDTTTAPAQDSNQKFSKLLDVEEGTYEQDSIGPIRYSTGKGPNLRMEGDITKLENDVAIDTTVFFDVDSDADNPNVNPAQENPAQLEIIEDILKAVPKHIRDLVTLHPEHNNPAQERGAFGFFAVDYEGDGPQIHVDARPGTRTTEAVLQTLSEEINHFGLNSWSTDVNNLGPLAVVYEKAYEAFKPGIINNLQAYVDRGDIDVNNPTLDQKWLLVNEFISKQGAAIQGIKSKQIPSADRFDITSQEIESIKAEVLQAEETFALNLVDVADIDPSNQEQAKKFFVDLLRNQAVSVSNKSVTFEYRHKAGLDEKTLVIRNTPFGQVKFTKGDGREEGRIRRRLRRLEQNSGNPLARKMWKALYQNSFFGEGIMGPTIRRILSNRATDDNHDIAALVRSHKHLQKLEAAARQKGFYKTGGGTFDGGALATLQKHGVKNKVLTKAAKEYDSVAAITKVRKLELNEEVHAVVADQIAWVKQQVTDNNLNSQVAARMVSELNSFGSSIKRTWDHVRYKAYEDIEDHTTLRDMIVYLKGDSTAKGFRDFAAEHETAKFQLDTLLRGREQTELSAKELRKVIDLENQMEPFIRLGHLRRMFELQTAKDPARNPNSEIPRRMINRIRKILQDVDGMQGAQGLAKVEKVDAIQHRRLDQDAAEFTSDWHEIQFLGKITDPVEVGIHNVDQLTRVKRVLTSNFELGKTLVDHGLAEVAIGSENTAVDLRDQQRGSILKYLDVDHDIAVDIQEFYTSNRLLIENFWEGVVTDSVNHVKLSATVFSAFGLASNFVAVPSMMAFYGDLGSFSKFGNLVSGSNIVLARKLAGVDIGGRPNPKKGKEYINSIINEMEAAKVLGTGSQAFIQDRVLRGSAIEKLSKLATASLNAVGLMSDANKINRDAQIETTVAGLKELYSFGDDIPKIMRYMKNKDLFLAKHEALLGKEDFATDQARMDMIEKLAARDAASRTLDEETDLSSIPQFLQTGANSSRRVFIGNFVIHAQQMTKIQLKNVRIWGELLEDRRIARAGIKKGGPQAEAYRKWNRTLRQQMVARAIGNSIIYSTIGATAVGASMLTGGLNEVLDQALEDDDDDKLRDDQVEAASNLARFIPFSQAGVFYQPIRVKDGDEVIFVDAPRTSQFGATIAPPDQSGEVKAPQQFGRALLNSFVAGEQGSILTTIFGAVQGKDWTGKTVSDAEYWDNIKKQFGNLMTPGAAKEASQLITGDSWYNDKPLNKWDRIMRPLGVRVKHLNVNKMVSNVAGQLSRDLRDHYSVQKIVDEIARGRQVYTDKELIPMVLADRKENAKKDKTYHFFIENVKALDMMDAAKIRKNLYVQHGNTKKKTGLPKAFIDNVYNQKAIFDLNSLKKIDAKIKDVSQRTATKKYTAEERDIALDGLRRLRKQYKDILVK